MKDGNENGALVAVFHFFDRFEGNLKRYAATTSS